MTSTDPPATRGRHRPRLPRRKRTTPGASPGTLVADPQAHGTYLRVTAYSGDAIEEHEILDVEQLAALRGRWPVLWVDVVGLGDIDVLRRIGDLFGLHPLQLEDIVNVHQRAKTEHYDANLFVVARMPVPGEHFDSEQIAMTLGEGWLLTFQERPGDAFSPVRERLRRGGRVRTQGADYLAYALLDSIIDAYFPVLERHGERVEQVEEQVITVTARQQVNEIHALRRELLAMRRAVWPLREMMAALLRDESSLIADSTRVFLRDCHDHVIQAMDMVEMLRDVTAGLLDLYLSSLSARMNDVMRVLTVIATIFIPLTFIVGLYGMNFANPDSPWAMPELRWYYGYPLVMGLMLAVVVVMLAWFKRRGWL